MDTQIETTLDEVMFFEVLLIGLDDATGQLDDKLDYLSSVASGIPAF